MGQSLVLYCFFFLIYIINDIADDMLGLRRFYAAGEKSFEINNLRSMVNID